MPPPPENSGAANKVRLLAAPDGASRTYDGLKSRPPRLPALLNDKAAHSPRRAA
jgi:hypothetical protein